MDLLPRRAAALMGGVLPALAVEKPQERHRLSRAGAPVGASTFLEAAGAEPLPDRDRANGSRAVLIDYPNCRGAPLRLIRVARGGHTWPGGPQFLPRFMVGRVNRDFDASEAIWDFFKTVPRR